MTVVIKLLFGAFNYNLVSLNHSEKEVFSRIKILIKNQNVWHQYNMQSVYTLNCVDYVSPTLLVRQRYLRNIFNYVNVFLIYF